MNDNNKNLVIGTRVRIRELDLRIWTATCVKEFSGRTGTIERIEQPVRTQRLVELPFLVVFDEPAPSADAFHFAAEELEVLTTKSGQP